LGGENLNFMEIDSWQGVKEWSVPFPVAKNGGNPACSYSDASSMASFTHSSPVLAAARM
jgi:hypothetical protein